MTSEVTRFGLAGLGAVALLTGLVLVGVSRVSTSESLRAAREQARLAGYGIVEPALTDALIKDRPDSDASIAAIDSLVQTRVLSERVLRVKLWTADGRIVYSDEPRLIGSRFPPKADHAEVLASGGMQSEIANTSSPENRYERDAGRLLEVYLPLRLPGGELVVYEQYERYNSVTANSRRLFLQLAIPLGLGLAMLWLTQLPLARSLARRVHAAEADRLHLVEQAVTASERERERIAADLHDSVVQDLAGISFELAAIVPSTEAGPVRDAVERNADIARTSMQKLRSSLVDLYPPNVHGVGLSEAIEELAGPLRASGTKVHVAVDAGELDPDVESLLYRVSQELLRNVLEHAHADEVFVGTEIEDGVVRLRVSDNGSGFSEVERAERIRDGHLGLDLHASLVNRAGGTLVVASTPGKGTVATAEVPT